MPGAIAGDVLDRLLRRESTTRPRGKRRGARWPSPPRSRGSIAESDPPPAGLPRRGIVRSARTRSSARTRHARRRRARRATRAASSASTRLVHEQGLGRRCVHPVVGSWRSARSPAPARSRRSIKSRCGSCPTRRRSRRRDLLKRCLQALAAAWDDQVNRVVLASPTCAAPRARRRRRGRCSRRAGPRATAAWGGDLGERGVGVSTPWRIRAGRSRCQTLRTARSRRS